MGKVISLTGLLLASLCAQPAVADPEGTMDLLRAWVYGYYNNEQQVAADLERGVPDDQQHRLMHQLFVPAEVPEIPGHIVFQQASTDGSTDPRWIVRVGLLQFFVDPDAGLVRQRELHFNDPERYKNGHLHPERLASLTLADVNFDPACDFYIQANPEGTRVSGPMPPDNCRLNRQDMGMELIAEDRIDIGPDHYAFLGRYVDSAGNVMWGTSSEELNHLVRVSDVETYMAGQQRPVLIFGASQGTGLEVARLLTARGDAVTAFVRPTSERSALDGLGVDFVVGDALNESDVQAAFDRGAYSAVISTLGCRGCEQRPDYVGNRNVIDSAAAARVDRLILVSSIGAGDSADATPWLAKVFLREILPLKTQAEEHLRASGLDYTVLRPGALKDGPASGRGTLTEDRSAMGIISRADLAALAVRCLDDDDSIGHTYAAIDPELSWPWDIL